MAAGAVAGLAQGQGIALHADAEKADAHVGRRRTEDRNRKALRLAAGSPFAMKLPPVNRTQTDLDRRCRYLAAAAAANVHIQGGDIDADRRAGDKAGACAGLLFNGHLPHLRQRRRVGMRPVRQLHRSGFIEGYRNPHRGLLLRHQRRERRTVAYHHRLAAGGVAAIDGTHRAAGALEAEGVTNAVDSAGVDMLSVNHHRRAAGFQLLIDDAFGARRRQLQVAGKGDPAAVIRHRAGHLGIDRQRG